MWLFTQSRVEGGYRMVPFLLASYADVLRLVTRSRDKPKNVCVEATFLLTDLILTVFCFQQLKVIHPNLRKRKKKKSLLKLKKAKKLRKRKRQRWNTEQQLSPHPPPALVSLLLTRPSQCFFDSPLLPSSTVVFIYSFACCFFFNWRLSC